MKRIDRIKWTTDKFGILSEGKILDVFDNAIKTIYRIDDNEFDYACKILTDEEFNLFLDSEISFSDKRKILTILEEKIYGFV